MTWSTATYSFLTATLADRLFGSWDGFGFVLLASLEICQSSSLIVDISNLFVTLDVELSDPLPSWCAQGLLEVGSEPAPGICCSLADTVLIVHRLGFIAGLVLLVEATQSVSESLTDSMFLIQLNCLLNDLIGHLVTMGKVFSNDS